MADCIFCRIASGDVPADVVCENDLIIAFMDISPVAPGHLLVIPKRHSTDITGMTDDEIVAVARALRSLAPAAMAAVEAEGYNILNNRGRAAGQAVEHVHFHVIPRTSGDGRGYRWLTMEMPADERRRIASDIASKAR